MCQRPAAQVDSGGLQPRQRKLEQNSPQQLLRCPLLEVLHVPHLANASPTPPQTRNARVSSAKREQP